MTNRDIYAYLSKVIVFGTNKATLKTEKGEYSFNYDNYQIPESIFSYMTHRMRFGYHSFSFNTLNKNNIFGNQLHDFKNYLSYKRDCAAFKKLLDEKYFNYLVLKSELLRLTD